jgi:hypothetical protein
LAGGWNSVAVLFSAAGGIYMDSSSSLGWRGPSGAMSGSSTLAFSLPAAAAAMWTCPRKCLGLLGSSLDWRAVKRSTDQHLPTGRTEKPELALRARRSMAHDTGGFGIRTRSSWTASRTGTMATSR